MSHFSPLHPVEPEQSNTFSISDLGHFVNVERDPVDDSSKSRAELIRELGHLRIKTKTLLATLDGQRQLMENMVVAHDRDRRLMAFDIHDGLVQDATGAQMCLDSLMNSENLPDDDARNQFQLARDLILRAVTEARHLINGLRPPILDAWGLISAIEYLIDDVPSGGPLIDFQADVEFDRLEPQLEVSIFRIVQEAITNVRRHSRSERARVRLSQTGDRIELEICDWGVGFNTKGVPDDRLGLQGIRERAERFSGRILVESAPGKGTRILIGLPLLEAPEELATTKSTE